MGQWISSTFQSLFGKRDIRVIVRGLDAAGKTSVLYRMKLGTPITTIPTIGFNVETLRFRNVTFTAWDCGGGCKLRPLVRHYYVNVYGIIFVVDSRDKERIGEVNDTLNEIFSDELLEGAPILIFANKQDIADAMSAEEVAEKLKLSSRTGHVYFVQACSAISGDGLKEGFEWLADRIKEKMV